ncbi:DUF4230 domain-containing protein [Leptolyngbya boryana CZ1]|uniref:DUF4230 domain-containing protein n=1 Tax=Leptolyngbya boryana CZ1 TaxID=3060204 RepID=A0AA96X129_LEPBY|nr:DUF4230 domain-containing protein [Leptolyngbya boryana]WNZ49092.1 DUF4230 domain-containing protein [Leptolyngbya boryana CZ1]
MRRRNRQKREGSSVFKNLSLMLAGSGLLLGVVLLVGFARSGNQFFDHLRSLIDSKSPEPKVETRSVVIQQVRQASELTTAVFTMEAVVPTQQDAAIAGVVIGTTKLLYIARGEVRAGVDLSTLKPDNVQIVGDTIRLQLPAPKILDKKIDVTRSSVYDYNRGPLGLGPDVAPNLQKLAQDEALKKIQLAACSDGILDKANDRAKLVVTSLIRVSGIKDVIVEPQPGNPQQCLAS